MQKGEIKKAIDFASEKTSLFQMLLPYVEYKERVDMIPKMQDLLKKWNDAIQSVGNRYVQLEKDPNSATIQ
jgi:hypothetical protein